jgi:hypothetical protein
MNHDFMLSGIDGYSSSRADNSLSRYLEKYWIDREALEHDWAPLFESVFRRSSGKVSVANNFVVDILQGGILFTKDEFLEFEARAKEQGANRFAVVEDIGQRDWHALKRVDFFRFSYPVTVSWEEMARSSILAQDVFERPIRCFFVITDNGKLGKYANNDADPPYDLVFHI